MQKRITSPWVKMDLSNWNVVTKPEYLVSLPRNTCIFNQSETIDHVFIIKDGRALLSVFSRDGTEKILMFAGTGGVFGEQTVFDGLPVSYCATSLVECQIYKIPQSVFRYQLCNNKEFCIMIMQLLMRKERILSTQIVDLSFGNAYQRIAAELLYSSEIYGVSMKSGILIDIPITHQDLGNKVHATRTTVSKALHQMIDSNIIGRRSRKFIVKDMDALTSIRENLHEAL